MTPFASYWPATALRGHLARNNDHWRLAQTATTESLVIVRGPEAYVSPSWYAAKAERGRVVPTWNYVTAHVYGNLVVHDDVEWVQGLVGELTNKHESGREHEWAVTDAPPRYIDGQLRAIVGIELVITRVEAEFKLSQNRSSADIEGVIAALDAAGDTESARFMRAHVPPA